MTFKTQFNEYILENDVIGFFKNQVKLASGRESHWYANWRTLTQDAWSTQAIGHFVMAFTSEKELRPDTFYGVPDGATKIGLVTQVLWAERNGIDKGTHTLAMGRKNPKEHGDPKDRYFLGVPRGKTIIIEDVTTTGDSLLKAIDQCQEAKVNVIGAISLTDRMEKRDDGISVAEAVALRGIPYIAMSTAEELLPLAYQKLQPGIEIGLAVEEEYRKLGVKSLNVVGKLHG